MLEEVLRAALFSRKPKYWQSKIQSLAAHPHNDFN
jgi:hypothetical protein